MNAQIEITRLAHGGNGIGYIDGKICFVHYGLPGDTLEVEIVIDKKNFCKGRIVEIITPSPDRIKVDCPVYDRERLGAADEFAGPAIIEEWNATTIVHPGQHLEVDAYGNLIITQESAS